MFWHLVMNQGSVSVATVFFPHRKAKRSNKNCHFFLKNILDKVLRTLILLNIYFWVHFNILCVWTTCTHETLLYIKVEWEHTWVIENILGWLRCQLTCLRKNVCHTNGRPLGAWHTLKTEMKHVFNFKENEWQNSSFHVKIQNVEWFWIVLEKKICSTWILRTSFSWVDERCSHSTLAECRT